MRVMTLGGLSGVGQVATVVDPPHGPYFDAWGSSLTGRGGVAGLGALSERTKGLLALAGAFGAGLAVGMLAAKRRRR